MPARRREGIFAQQQQPILVDPAHTDDCAQLNDNLEDPPRWPAKTKEIDKEDEVARGGHREKLGDALYCPEKSSGSIVSDSHVGIWPQVKAIV